MLLVLLAGIHQQGILANPDTYEFVKPDVFGRHRELFVSRHSGKSIIKYILEKNNLLPCADFVELLYEECINSRVENSCLSMQQLESEVKSLFIYLDKTA
ncbi:hypothetical protein ACN08N_17020 [Photobacterium leiognathi subsp. mandapamensis]